MLSLLRQNVLKECKYLMIVYGTRFCTYPCVNSNITQDAVTLCHKCAMLAKLVYLPIYRITSPAL